MDILLFIHVVTFCSPFFSPLEAKRALCINHWNPFKRSRGVGLLYIAKLLIKRGQAEICVMNCSACLQCRVILSLFPPFVLSVVSFFFMSDSEFFENSTLTPSTSQA